MTSALNFAAVCGPKEAATMVTPATSNRPAVTAGENVTADTRVIPKALS